MKNNVSKLMYAVLSLSVIAGAVFGPVQTAAACAGRSGGGIGGVLSASTLLK